MRDAASTYPYAWVFGVQNMRNAFFQQVRLALREDGRIFWGKNRVMAKALGEADSDEPVPGIHGLGAHLTGDVGLLFTSRSQADLQAYLEGLGEVDYARTGCVASRTVILDPRQIEEDGGIRKGCSDDGEDEGAGDDNALIPATAEPQLRALGLPTRLRGGTILLNTDTPHTVCREGEVLTSEQVRLLKMLGIKMAHFRVNLLASYHDGRVVVKTACDDDDDAEQ